MGHVVGLPETTLSFLPDGEWVSGHDAGGVVQHDGVVSHRAYEWRFHLRCDGERVVWCDAHRFASWRGRGDGAALLGRTPWTATVRSVPLARCELRVRDDGVAELLPPGWRAWVALDAALGPVEVAEPPAHPVAV